MHSCDEIYDHKLLLICLAFTRFWFQVFSVCGFSWASDKNYCSVFDMCYYRNESAGIQFFSPSSSEEKLQKKVIIHMRIFFLQHRQKNIFPFRIDRISSRNFAFVTKFNLAFSPFHIQKTYEIYAEEEIYFRTLEIATTWNERKSQSNTENSEHTHGVNVKWKIANEDEAERQSILI